MKRGFPEPYYRSFKRALQIVALLTLALTCSGHSAADYFEGTSAPSSWDDFPTPNSGFIPSIDPAFKNIFQNGQKGLDWYGEKRAERKRLIDLGKGEEFSIPELRTTLINIANFIEVILNDRQFSTPLSYQEKKAIQLLKKDVYELIKSPKPPYLRTIRVTTTFTVMYDTLVYSKVTKNFYAEKFNLRERFTEFNTISLSTADDNHFIFYEYDSSINLDTLYRHFMKLEEVDGYNNSSGRYYSIHALTPLQSAFADERAILYPSFNPFDIDDFARLAPVPVYPLGLMSQYALNADGYLMSPLKFMLHDAAHIVRHAGYKHIDGNGPLESMASRLAFVQSALDSGSEHLDHHNDAKKAVELALFNIFHERCFISEHSRRVCTRERLESESYDYLYSVMVYQQTKNTYHFSSTYRELTREGILAGAVWVHELYKFWKTGKDKADEVTSSEVMPNAVWAYNQRYKHSNPIEEARSLEEKALSPEEMAIFYEQYFKPALIQAEEL
ncbi:hypothetical protein EOPP23_01945 [Endozoicomonas sp. OPT23]|uniref:hypothetical protein n=1 Tax=Endozoicomonas sp. OPT23 TaxID=2072845 RepID=UPI00129A1B9C|nr:hypothetical protein [Endozoicomonas sp. OPT23]MRI31757.1 hypothetical protein [Endozoicomonas sp. OPT23]